MSEKATLRDVRLRMSRADLVDLLELADEKHAYELERQADMRVQLDHAQQERDTAREARKRDYDRLTEENNDLRGRLYTAEIEAARLRGYHEALRDQEPPLMVPAPRKAMIDSSSIDPRVFSELGHSKKRWFHK